jgi:hypothetical protein
MHGKNMKILIISRSVLLRIRNVSDKVVEKIKTHFLCPETFFDTPDIYENMWKNIIDSERPQMTIWRMRFAH